MGNPPCNRNYSKNNKLCVYIQADFIQKKYKNTSMMENLQDIMQDITYLEFIRKIEDDDFVFSLLFCCEFIQNPQLYLPPCQKCEIGNYKIIINKEKKFKKQYECDNYLCRKRESIIRNCLLKNCGNISNILYIAATFCIKKTIADVNGESKIKEETIS
jgi:hypothetical protein